MGDSCILYKHYYFCGSKAGIGKFDAGTSNSGISFIGRLRASIGSMMDQAIGTTFEYHVSAGYKFLMRFYSPGDAIYIFGFSRGAYTARFLAEMINVIVRPPVPGKRRYDPRDQERYLEHFKRTFCRRDVKPPAVHIRHAVSIHERRLKFKPALFLFEKDHQDSDIHEVWFAGNHFDVGGGFHYEGPGKHLLSDIPLAWMIDQVNALEDQPAGKLAFDQETINQRGHMKAGRAPVLLPTHGLSSHTPRESALKERRPHDFLAFDRGVTRFATLMWWILEILPLFTRLELEYGEWIPRYWPPNLGATRDIPRDAKIHCSVVQLYKAGVLSEMPRLGGDLPPFLEDPILLIKSLPFMLLRILMPWYWAGCWGKQKKIPPKTQEAIKKKITKGVESHGARSWSWTY
ncbi:predicted protein [Histoplasma mississippiense (nom. inval.)]|uniref:predicted protein n=1 Tax=Ajellomyces capsulatus (strain NAm1 / WU24) TaxID=2059318 RepID=UPI000157B44C|nr:predicted protein [Histoplasma mississippiense (nom. inval.)]EDN02766.1 predicted protein [Histoplasma mississippiense (nom. inval.)]